MKNTGIHYDVYMWFLDQGFSSKSAYSMATLGFGYND